MWYFLAPSYLTVYSHYSHLKTQRTLWGKPLFILHLKKYTIVYMFLFIFQNISQESPSLCQIINFISLLLQCSFTCIFNIFQMFSLFNVSLNISIQLFFYWKLLHRSVMDLSRILIFEFITSLSTIFTNELFSWLYLQTVVN